MSLRLETYKCLNNGTQGHPTLYMCVMIFENILPIPHTIRTVDS